MLTIPSYKDKNIVSRSFRFISPNTSNIANIFKNVDYDLETSYFSTAVGDSRYVNPLPGYGFNTDPSPGIAIPGTIKNSFGNEGRYYKRVHSDNATILTLTPSTVEFTGILQFITNMFDYSASTIANKGRAPYWTFYLTETMSAIAFWPFQLIGVGLNFLGFLFDEPKNQWYTLKKAMGSYLAASQGLFNDLMINAGFTITAFNDSRQQTGNEKRNDRDYFEGTINGYPAGDSSEAKSNNIAYMNHLFPDAINSDGTVDIVKLIGRGPRKYRYFLQQLKDLDKKATGTITATQKNELAEAQLDALVKNPSFMNGTINPTSKMNTAEYLKKELQTTAKFRGVNENSNPEVASAYYDADVARSIVPTDASGNTVAKDAVSSAGDLKDVKKVVNDFGYMSSNSTTDKTAPSTGSYSASGSQTAANGLNGDIPASTISLDKGVSQEHWLGQVGEILQDGFLGGMDSVSFRVEGGVGSVSDSFSNQTKQSEVASMFNGSVNAISDFRFNLQGGDIGIPIVKSVIDHIKDGVAGLASGSVIGNIPMALMGNSKIEIPEHWSDSSTSLHTESYTIYGEALYAHPYAIATAVYLPLALIGPMIWPIATGGGTYSTPFMCKAFCRGRTIIKRGIVKNASIVFGEGPLGWTKDRKPLNIRINLEIADCDQILAMVVSRMRNPMDLGNPTRISGTYLGDVGKYNDYLARVGGADYLDTVLKFNKLNRIVTRFNTDVKQMFSASNVACAVNDSVVGTVANIFTNRPLNR